MRKWPDLKKSSTVSGCALRDFSGVALVSELTGGISRAKVAGAKADSISSRPENEKNNST